MGWVKGVIMGVFSLILIVNFVSGSLVDFAGEWYIDLLIWALPALAGFAVLWYMLDRAFKGGGD